MAANVKPERFIVNQRGKPTAVVLSLLTYQKLLRLVEDHEDAQQLKRAIRTSRGTLSHTELLGRLKKQRLI